MSSACQDRRHQPTLGSCQKLFSQCLGSLSSILEQGLERLKHDPEQVSLNTHGVPHAPPNAVGNARCIAAALLSICCDSAINVLSICGCIRNLAALHKHNLWGCPSSPAHHEVQKHYQSTSKLHVGVLHDFCSAAWAWTPYLGHCISGKIWDSVSN